jgi:ribosome-binding factor A
MSTLRITKINSLIRKYLAEIMERELSLKAGVFITIAKVDTSRDLRYTRMFISVFPEQETRYVSETLRKELSQIQKSLYAKISMKPMPKLSFEIDKTEQEADKIEKALKDIYEDI